MKLEFETRWGGKVEIYRNENRTLQALLTVWRWEKEAWQTLLSVTLEAKTFDEALKEAQILWGWHKDRKKLNE